MVDRKDPRPRARNAFVLLFNAIDPFKTKKLFTLVEVVGPSY